MYSPIIVQKKILRAIQIKLIPGPPTYHSRAECENMIKHLDTIWDPEVEKWIRPPTVDEVAWIRHERFLCKVDFRYLSERYCWIKSAADIPIRFTLWPSQSILLDIIAENEAERISIELMILKARQLGISRLVSLLLTHRVLNFPNLNAALASSTPDKTGKLANMLEFTMDYLPHWLKPTLTNDRHSVKQTGGIWREWENGTTLTLQHGAMMTGIARGETPTVNWLSEVSEYQNADEIDSSLFRAVHQHWRVMTLLESTALGTQGWWHDTWQVSKEGWPARRSRLRPVFLPWFVGGLYPTPDFIRRSPVPDNYRPAQFVLEHARRAKEYVHSDPLLSKHLGRDWTMPKEQQWFYEVERSESERKDRLPIFLQEMPASDIEAFQNTSRSVFGSEVIINYRDRVKTPLGVFGLYGPEHIMPYRIQPHVSQIDTQLPRIPIDYIWGQTPIRFELVPLRWHGYHIDSGLDKIYIYEWPERGELYGIGCDTAEGVNRDNTTLEGLRKGNSWRPAGQTFEFASGKLNAVDIVPYLQAMAAFYSVTNYTIGATSADPPDEFRNQCRVAIERKGMGSETQNKMHLNGWANFHRDLRTDNRDIDQSNYRKIGIDTNEGTREIIITTMNQKLRDNEISICSPYFVMEMGKLVDNGIRIEGSPDDRFFAMGFITVSMYQFERNRPVATAPPPRSEPPSRHYATYPKNAQELVGGQDAIYSDEPGRLY